jgi:hypothetical protein
VVKYLHLVVCKEARFLLWARFLSPNKVTYCAYISPYLPAAILSQIMKIEASLLVMISSFAFERTWLGLKYVQIQEFHGFFALNLLGCRCHAAFLRCIGLCVRGKWGLRLLVFLSFFGLFA